MKETKKVKRKLDDYDHDVKDKGFSKALVVRDNDQDTERRIINTTISIPKQIENPLEATIKKTLSFGHKAFGGRKVLSGHETMWHTFSNINFSDKDEKKGTPKEQLSAYIKDTGLQAIQTKQDWGLGSSVMYRSRRGSIGGFSELEGGGIQGWRMHALPTSEAFKENPSSENEFLDAFNSRATLMTKRALNTRKSETKINAILSDVGKVGFDKDSGKFELKESTHAMGISGSGVDKEFSSESEDLYLPSIEVVKRHGSKPTASSTYHSEPMSITLHNQLRTKKMENDSDLVGMFASFPNQVCFDCGRMFKEMTGERSVMSGVPGLNFKKQKEGPVFNESLKTTVIRAKPMEDLLKDEENLSELRHLYAYHKK